MMMMIMMTFLTFWVVHLPVEPNGTEQQAIRVSYVMKLISWFGVVDSREPSTTRCYILTDEQYLCSDKSAIFFEPDTSNQVVSTGSPDDVDVVMEVKAGGSQRGDGYFQLTR